VVPAFCRRVPAPGGTQQLTAGETAAEGRSADYAQGQCRGTAALDQPGEMMPAVAIGLGLRQRLGIPQPPEPGHPPLLHQAITVADVFVAGAQVTSIMR